MVQKILTEQYQRAVTTINENKKLHEKISEDLLQMEEMDRKEFETYFA